jgi:hypothetical protein
MFCPGRDFIDIHPLTPIFLSHLINRAMIFHHVQRCASPGQKAAKFFGFLHYLPFVVFLK